jgi:hypothetical protein
VVAALGLVAAGLALGLIRRVEEAS